MPPGGEQYEDPMDNLDETASVISASKVTGTNVYNTDGDHLGEINDIMLEKRSGNIAYAVMSFGGFLGIGERYHALPWAALKYDTRQGGYVVGLTIDQLKEAQSTVSELIVRSAGQDPQGTRGPGQDRPS